MLTLKGMVLTVKINEFSYIDKKTKEKQTKQYQTVQVLTNGKGPAQLHNMKDYDLKKVYKPGEIEASVYVDPYVTKAGAVGFSFVAVA